MTLFCICDSGGQQPGNILETQFRNTRTIHHVKKVIAPLKNKHVNNI